MYSDDVTWTSFYSDQWNPGYDEWNNAFVATSSNPDIVGVAGIYPSDYYYRDYDIALVSGKPGVKGKATITITAPDSGKTAKFTVVVK